MFMPLLLSTRIAQFRDVQDLPIPSRVAPVLAGEIATRRLTIEATQVGLADNSVSGAELFTAVVKGSGFGGKYWQRMSESPNARPAFSLNTDPKFLRLNSDQPLSVEFPIAAGTEASLPVPAQHRGFVYRMQYVLVTTERRMDPVVKKFETRVEQKEWFSYRTMVVPYGKVWNPITREMSDERQ